MSETSPSFRRGIHISAKKRKSENNLDAGRPGPKLLQIKEARRAASPKPPVDAVAPTPNVEGCGGHGLAGGGAGGGAFVMPGGGALKPVMVWADESTIILLSVPAAVYTRINAAVIADLSFIFGAEVARRNRRGGGRAKPSRRARRSACRRASDAKGAWPFQRCRLLCEVRERERESERARERN